jgi:hypothetical protein
MTTTRTRPEPPVRRPRPSEERDQLADQGRSTRRVAIAALVLALAGTALTASRFVLPAAASCQQASWDVRPAQADIPTGFSLSASQYDINRQQVTFLGPVPADESQTQGVVYVTVTCFDEGAGDALARSEQAARDANQVVTARQDLGDGGFSAVDDGGSTFLQLRHGNVIAYLAASSGVAASDVDALASAYDRAMGGDGGAVAVGTQDPGAEQPSDATGSDLPSDEAPSAAAAPELEAKLPAEVQGTPLTRNSAIGTDLFSDDQSSRAIVAALRTDGKTPADVTYAEANDESGTLDLSMFAVAVDGLSEAKTRRLVIDTWLGASGAGISEKSVKLGGRDVTRVDYGDEGSKYYLLDADGAVIVLSTADEALATAAIQALP